MKKLCVLIMVLSLMLLAACGGKEPIQNPDPSAGTEMQPAQTQTEAGAVDEEQNVSEDDFRTASLGDGRCEIVGCSSTAKVIQVPETLFGETVVGIGTNAFCALEAEKITLPDTVEYLAKNAFNTCEKLEEVDLGKGLKRTGVFSFNLCNALQSVTFPEGMEEMTECCFGGCEKLGEVYVPTSVTMFGSLILDPVLCPEAVIVTPAGSAAEANAQEYGIPYRNP